MYNKYLKRFVILSLPFITTTIFATQVFAIDNVVETTFFGNLKDDGEGCGVYTILNSVVDILSIGIGILAIIGITIAGIKYLTAKGNIDQTKKAKHRILQIVIGLVAYVLLYAGIQWLLPGGKLNTNQQCTTISNQELATLKEQEREEKEAARAKTEPKKQNSSQTNAAIDQSSSNLTPAEKLSNKAVELAWPAGTSKKKYYNQATAAFTAAMKATGTNKGESGCRKSGKACGMFVGTVVRASGVDKNMPTMASRIYDYVRGVGKYKGKGGDKKWKKVSTKNPKPGDISLSHFKKNGEAGHVSIYVKNKKGKTVTAQASLCDFYGIVGTKKQYTGSSNKTYRYVGK